MNSLFSCPLCDAPLTPTPSNLTCPNSHTFDRSASGYVHLLPANRKHSKNPGDDKEMVVARSSFLERGYYDPIEKTLCSLAQQYTASLDSPAILDSGCGEGYYTSHLYTALYEKHPNIKIAGVDISKFALKRAAKRLPQGEFAVASVYRLPVPTASIDLLTNIFSPLAIEEFSRVIKPGGHFIYAVPSPKHLWEMKEVLYPAPYENAVKQESYPSFEWFDVHKIRYSVTLATTQDIMALFHMTPYAWKTPKSGIEKLASCDQLTIQIGFDLHCYRRV